MFKKGGRSLIVILVLGVLVFLAVSIFFAGLANDQDAVVAKVPLSAGTRLSPELLEVRRINASAALPGVFDNLEDLKGQILVSARLPGDQITRDMVGSQAISALAAALAPGHVAVAVSVDQATGLAGIVRVGDSVGAVGVITAQDLGLQETFGALALSTPVSNGVVTPTVRATPTPKLPQGGEARVVLSDLRVLVVPQSFRYEETAPSSSGDSFTTVRATSEQQTRSVIVLEVPVAPVEIAPGYAASPVELLALLNAKGKLHLFLQPSTKGALPATTGVDAQELLQAIAGQ